MTGRAAFLRVFLVPFGLLVSLLGMGCADKIPFSSGALEGEVVANPADWTEVGAPSIIQFETQGAGKQGEQAYSVNLWVIGEKEKLYVYAGDNRTTWVEHIETNRNVRLRSGGKLYELAAKRVTDPEEFESFAQAWGLKYGHRPRNENVGETWLMRLRPRQK